MTFLAPWYLVAGALASVALIVLHLIARQRPRSAPLPTARFIPDRQVRAPSRSVWPTDLPLLLLRLTIITLVATAFARPVWTERRADTIRIVVADRSRAVASIAEIADSARSLLRAGDVLIGFDTIAQPIARESLAVVATGRRVSGSLSSALLAGIRQARSEAATTDSVDLVVISPFAEEEWDAATDSVRALWRSRIRVVRVAPAQPPIVGGRIVRGAITAADTSWARDSGGALVLWPRGEVADSSSAVTAGDVTVVAPFGRRLLAGAAVHASVRVVARWVDGAPAAVESPLGAGCVRDLGIEVPEAGDLVLRASYRRLHARLTAPCGIAPRLAPVDTARLARFAGERLPRAAGLDVRPEYGRLPAALLALGLLLALAELLLRRRRSEG